MKRIMTFGGWVMVPILLTSAGLAQPATQTTPPPPPPATTMAPAETPTPPPAEGVETPAEGTTAQGNGDYVILKTGKQLNNIYIIRVTPLTVEIGYSPERADLKIPRKQIQEIHQAGKLRQAGNMENQPAQEGTNAFPAAELDSTFHQKLTTPLPETPLTYENQDITKILTELAIKADVSIKIADEVSQLPVAKRQVSVTVNRGTTLAEFLHQELNKIAPDIQVQFAFDHVEISLRDQQ